MGQSSSGNPSNSTNTNITKNPDYDGPATLESYKKAEFSEILDKLYIVYFRHGMNPACQKAFYHNGSLKEASNRAIKHCFLMGYTFHWVRPLICDLEEEEASLELRRSKMG